MLYIKAYIYLTVFYSKNGSCERAMLKNGTSVEIAV